MLGCELTALSWCWWLLDAAIEMLAVNWAASSGINLTADCKAPEWREAHSLPAQARQSQLLATRCKATKAGHATHPCEWEWWEQPAPLHSWSLPLLLA